MGGSRRTLLIAAVVAAGLLVGAGVVVALSRGGPPDAAEPTTPLPTPPVPTTTPPSTTPPGPTPATSPAPTTSTTTVSVPSEPDPSADTIPLPDARDVPVESLLRPGAVQIRTVYGDLDGDGIEEIVLHSVAREPAPGSVVPQPFLDVFAFRDGDFVWVFDATGPAPDGAEHPEAMIRSDDPFVAQQVDFLELVEFRPFLPPSLVVGVVVIGASVGPLDVWVLALGADGLVTEFFEATQRGGRLTLDDFTLLLETGRYAPADPGCCPSRIERQRIGVDPATGRIAILSRTFERS